VSRAATRRAAFTLFEVLAAVVVLGLTVTMLARGAIQGLGAEGDASRRLSASFIADQLLYDVESQLALGNVPEVGTTEPEGAEDDGFLRSVEVTPLDLATLGIPDLYAPPGEKPGRTPAPGAAGAFPTLLLVNVRVAWEVGLDQEQAVTRTTIAYDATAAIEALASAGGDTSTADDDADANDLDPDEDLDLEGEEDEG